MPLSLCVYCDDLPECLSSIAFHYIQRYSIGTLLEPSQMKDVCKLSIVAVAPCRKHTFGVSLQMGRARQEKIVS
jgi:hypothetical protein